MSEINISNIETKKWYHCNYRVIGVAIGVVFLLLIIGNGYIYYLINKEKKSSTELISTILNNSAKEKSLIPDIVILNKNDSNGIKIDSTLKKELLKFLISKYNNDSSKASKVFDIKPFLSSTDIKDEDKIVKHIEFLVNTVNKAVEESKNNIDTEISKINTWVTIWIGVIGFIGIFLPIVINIKSFDDLKNIKSKSKEAKKNADDAKEKLEKYKPQLDSLPTLISQVSGFDKKIQAQENRIGNLDTKYTAIETTATNAETRSASTEKLLYTLNMVFKLKDIDGTFLMYNKEPLKVLIKYFEEIHKELSDKSIDFTHPFVFDALRQLALRLYVLAPYYFISKENMTLLNNLSEFISGKLEAGIDNSSFEEILQKFLLLINKLKQ